MKIVFVYSLDSINPARTKTLAWSSVPLGISYISAVLKACGYETSVVLLGSNHYQSSVDLLEKCLGDPGPDLICFTAVFSQYAFIEKIGQAARTRWPDTYLMIGGVHATLVPDQVISGPFDAVCIGEGEYPAAELCRQLEAQQKPHGIANLWIKSDDGGVQRNPPRDFIANLDEIPFPDLQIWKPWVADNFDEGLTILGGRGCPYACTYCCNNALRKTAGGSYVRTRSPENILEEVRFLAGHFPDNGEIFIEIETLDCNKRWTLELCSRLGDFNSRRPEPVVFGSNYRVNPGTIDEAVFAALGQAGFKHLNIGLESGSERVRREVLHRNYTNDDFLRVVSLARKYGLNIYLYNMIGLPGESRQDHQDTIELNRICQPDGHYTGIFYPYPGTALYATCLERGLIKDSGSQHGERRQPSMDLPDFTKAQIKSAYRWFDLRIYRGYRPTWKIVTEQTLNKFRAGRITKHLFYKVAGYWRALWRRTC